MECIFYKTPEDTCKCVRIDCPNELRGIEDCSKIRANCKSKISPLARNREKAPQGQVEEIIKSRPSLTKRGMNFAKAAYKFAKSGFKRRNQEEIERIFKICQSCELYQAISTEKGKEQGYCSHDSCGCNVKNINNFLNKLAWKSEDCPHPDGSKWKKL